MCLCLCLCVVCLPICVSMYVHFCAGGMWVWLCVWLFSCLWVGVCVSVDGFLTQARIGICLPSSLWEQARSKRRPPPQCPAVGPVVGQGRGQVITPESVPASSPGLGMALSHSLTTHSHTATKRETSCLSGQTLGSWGHQAKVGRSSARGGSRMWQGWGIPAQPLLQPCWALLRRLVVCSGPAWPSGFCAFVPLTSSRETNGQGWGQQCSSGWTKDVESEPSARDQSSALHTVPEGPPTFSLWPWVKGSLPLWWDSPPSPQPLPSLPHPARPQFGPTFSWHCALLSHFLNLLSCFWQSWNRPCGK